jgi:hypothetical protein
MSHLRHLLNKEVPDNITIGGDVARSQQGALEENGQLADGFANLQTANFARGEKKGHYKAKIATFSGAEVDKDVWIEEFLRIARNNFWSDEEKLLALKDALVRDAKKWFDAHATPEERRNFERLWRGLKTRFTSVASIVDTQRKFIRRVQVLS